MSRQSISHQGQERCDVGHRRLRGDPPRRAAAGRAVGECDAAAATCGNMAAATAAVAAVASVTRSSSVHWGPWLQLRLQLLGAERQQLIVLLAARRPSRPQRPQRQGGQAVGRGSRISRSARGTREPWQGAIRGRRLCRTAPSCGDGTRHPKLVWEEREADSRGLRRGGLHRSLHPRRSRAVV